MDLSEFPAALFRQRELCAISLCPPEVLGLVISFGSVLLRSYHGYASVIANYVGVFLFTLSR